MKTNFVPAFLPFLEEDARIKFGFGGRGGAKSISFGQCLSIKSASEQNEITLCTREIQKSIRESVHSLIVGQIMQMGLKHFRCGETKIYNKLTKSGFIFNGLSDQTVDNLKSIYNIKRAWIEEGHTLTQHSLDLLAPSIRMPGSELWFSYNPMFDTDPLHVYCMSFIETTKQMEFKDAATKKIYRWLEYRGRTETGQKVIGIKINYDGNPFFPEELEAERLKDKRERPEIYEWKWQGECLQESKKIIISKKLVLDAIERTVQPGYPFEAGADIAREGGDAVVFFKRNGNKIHEPAEFTLKDYGKRSIPETARRLISYIDYDKTCTIKVDDTGMGGGVTDLLLEDGYKNTIGVHNGQSAKDPERYPNAINEMWYESEAAMDDLDLPNCERLKNELTTRMGDINKKAQRIIEPKADWKKRFKKSPDFADAFHLCLYQPGTKVSGGAVYNPL